MQNTEEVQMLCPIDRVYVLEILTDSSKSLLIRIPLAVEFVKQSLMILPPHPQKTEVFQYVFTTPRSEVGEAKRDHAEFESISFNFYLGLHWSRTSTVSIAAA